MQLREWRKQNGFSLRGFARHCGVAEPTITAYERGTRKPRPDVAKRIEEATNGEVSAAQLLGIAVDPPANLSLRDRIRLEMASQKLNQRALADKAGLNESYVRDLLENPEQDPRLSKIVALVEALEKPASWLFGETLATNLSPARGVSEDGASFEYADKPWREPVTVPVEVELTAGQLEDYRKHLPDLEAVAAEGAREALRAAHWKAWNEANREAIDAHAKWIEERGTFHDQFGEW